MKKIFIFAALICFVVSTSSFAETNKLSKIETQIIKNVEEGNLDQIKLLEKVININSGSGNHKGIRNVGNEFKKELEKIGFKSWWIEFSKKMNRAGHLFARIKGNSKNKKLLIIGHIDTVFEADSSFQKYKRDGKYAYGPGINDMKGGLVSILFSLKALHKAGALKDLNITLAFMGDEEDPGEPYLKSRKPLIDEAKKSDYALGFEYGVDSIGFATIARRGYSDWKLEVTGIRGHSSRIFNEKFGAGAAFGISKILSKFYDDLPEELLTFNPGLLAAGSEVAFGKKGYEAKVIGKNNVISQIAIAKGDLRAISEKQREKAKKKMKSIVGKSLRGTEAKITFNDSYPPMAPKKGNSEILKILSNVSGDLGFGKVNALDPGRRGAADTSFVSPYVACIDGLGLLGDGAHSHKERIEIDTMSKITKRSALLFLRLSEQ